MKSASKKLNISEQKSAVNQNDRSVIFTCQTNSEYKSFVFMFYVISKNGIGSSVLSFGVLENRSVTCDAMMHVLKDFISLKYSELLTEEISKSN